MERSREARRSSSSSMATGNGQPKRRHRSNSLRDSTEEGQVELQEAVKLRSKRDRESLMNNRSKRKRTSSKREEGEESTEESVGDEEDEEYSTVVVEDNNHRRPARSSRHWKVTDEMIGVSVPRKARSSSAKRAHENLVTANGGKEELKAQPQNSQEDIEIEIAEVLYGLMKQSQSQSNKSSGNSSHELDPNPNLNDINGLSTVAATATAPQTCTKKRKMEGEKSSGTVENSEIESEQLEKTETSSPKECVSLESQQEVDAAVTVIMEEEDLKPSDKEGGIGDCVSPRKESATPCGGDELNAVEDVQDSTEGVLTVPEAENKREEKLEIDLMAMPPMPSSPDGDGFIDLISDHKPPVKDEEKVEKFVKKEMVVEESEDRRKNKVEAIGEKSELPKLDLEKLTQDSGSVRSIRLQQQQQAKASIPKVEKTEKTAPSDSLPFPIAVPGWLGGLHSLGYMPPFQTVVPMDGITGSATPLQPPQFSLSQPRPKRCATHHFIARNICLHQQYTKMSNFCPVPAGPAALGGAKMNNLNAVPPAEKMIFGNPFQGSFPGKSLNAVQEKGQAETNFPGHTGKDKGREAANLTETAQRKQVVLQQAPQLAPTGSLMSGPAFIFSMGQHPAVAAAGANQSGSSKHANSAKNIPLTSNTAAGSLGSNSASGPLRSSSVSPAVATAMSFNYPTFPANEAPYMAILQNNGYPVPISAPVGTSTAFRGSNPAQTMPFFNGPFYSSQMFHPSQLQQQQPHLQPLAQTTHQSTSTSSGLSSSHKQPRGAQGSGNNLLASSKQHVPPSNQSRKIEAETTRENTQSVADSQASHTQKGVYAQNFTVPGQPLNYTLMPSAALGVSSGGNHGEKQQQGLKNVVELFPSPAFGMSFAAFNGNTTASTLNFSSMPQSPVIFQSLPDMARQGYKVSPAPQAAQPKNHQVSEGKTRANSINSDDAKKATLGKPSTTTGQTLVFDNSARTLSFMSSPVVPGNWPSRSITSTTITTNAPTAGNTPNSQQQQLLQLQMQKQHMMQQHISSLSLSISKASSFCFFLLTMTKDVAEHGSFPAKDYHDPPPAPLFDPVELTKWSFYRALIAEFVATLLFLYVTVLTVIGYKSQIDPALKGDACGGVGYLGIAWAFGGMIFVLVYCTAGISGGHINPAVTFGLFLARKVSLIRAVLYMVAQCLGAICGVALVKAFQSAYYVKYGGGANSLSDGYSTGVGLGAEIIGTFVLVYTVFSATDPKRKARDSHVPVLAPLPIGFAVFIVHLATIPVTGTGINPARSLGAAVIYNNDTAWNDHWLFWVGPFIGAALAAFYHQFILRAGAAKALGSFRSNSSHV